MNNAQGLGLLVGALAVGAIAVSGVIPAGSYFRPRATPPPLVSKVSVIGEALAVEKAAKEPWENIRLVVNDTFELRRFAWCEQRVQGKEECFADLREFSGRGDGRRFDPLHFKVRRVSISADTPDGRRSGAFEFK